jgi:ABC-2 type transport system ATP-binding protein
MDVLRVQGLNKTFAGGLFEKAHRVLEDVHFHLPEGHTTGFVGSNGAGKTTTIKCLFDFIRPDSGEILFFNQKLTNQVKNRIGYLPERPYLYEFLSGAEFLKLHWKLCYGEDRSGFNERMQAVLRKVDLEKAAEKRLRTYSKGMLQRIGIAQAILTEPELLILDEPMSGLDPDGRALVKDILKEEQKRGCSLFFSSHLLSDMEELCSHLVVMDRGQILFNDTLPLFMKEYQSLEQAFKILKKERA